MRSNTNSANHKTIKFAISGAAHPLSRKSTCNQHFGNPESPKVFSSLKQLVVINSIKTFIPVIVKTNAESSLTIFKLMKAFSHSSKIQKS